MKLVPHDYTARRIEGEIILEWADDDTFIVEVKSKQIQDITGEGIEVHVDNGMASLAVGGCVSASASVVMTEKEARELHAELGRALDE